MRIGIISGYDMFTDNAKEIEVETPYGSIKQRYSKRGSREVFFVNRHLTNRPPHLTNYRAIVHSLKASGVECIISISTVGSINPSMKTGDFVVPHDFIDFTKSRNYTFYDDKRVHIDMTSPFCPSIRETLIKVCRGQGCHERGVYLATEGPRLETPAEIRMFSNFADVVGMTLVPEAVLAREREMCYAAICLVCNRAAGLQRALSANEIIEVVGQKKRALEKVLREVIKDIKEKRDCRCRNALERAML
jgi:5'-methylthioadenosine phosphorylase